MNMQTTGASIKELGAKIKHEWSKLTNDDLGLWESNKDEFSARIKKKEGMNMDGDAKLTKKNPRFF